MVGQGAEGDGVHGNPGVLNGDEGFRINVAMPVGEQHNALAGIPLVLDGIKGGLHGQVDVGAAVRRSDFANGVVPGRACRVGEIEQGGGEIAEKHNGQPGIAHRLLLHFIQGFLHFDDFAGH